jgi:NADH-quinone oxidoreductase subunit C
MDGKAIHETLVARFGEKVTGAGLEAVSPFTVVADDAIAEVAAFCKAEPDLAFDNLMCLSGVDYPKESPPRMEVVYHLHSYTHLHTHALKVQVPREAPAVPTVERTWGVANWHEREAWDLLGIVFTGHSDPGGSSSPTTGRGTPCARTGGTPSTTTGCT